MKEEIHITDGLPHSNTVEELINVICDMEKEKEELIKKLYNEKVKNLKSNKRAFFIGLWTGLAIALAFHYLNWL